MDLTGMRAISPNGHRCIGWKNLWMHLMITVLVEATLVCLSVAITTTDNSGFPPASINQAATLKTRPQAQASKPAIIKIPTPAEVKGVYLAPENRKK